MITHARHDSTANAFHTTVPCLSGRLENYYKFVYISMYILYSTKRILGIATLSRADYSVTQTREVECTKVILPRIIDELSKFTHY